MSVKNRGGLIFPSSVIQILKICETAFKGHCAGNNFTNPKMSSCKNLKAKIRYSVLSELRFRKIFVFLNNHHFENEQGSEDLHSTQLIEKIICKYLDIRMFSYGKFYEQTILKQGKIGLRKRFIKMVLFKGL